MCNVKGVACIDEPRNNNYPLTAGLGSGKSTESVSGTS